MKIVMTIKRLKIIVKRRRKKKREEGRRKGTQLRYERHEDT